MFPSHDRRLQYLTQMSNNQSLLLNNTTSSVLYYFHVRKDSEINSELACRSAEIFNKKSFYIDLDFDCQADDSTTNRLYDIYGAVTEPEIC